MRSSDGERNLPDRLSDPAALTARLLGRPVADWAMVVGRGANSRIFRVTAADGTRVALKFYPETAGDRRRRLDHEYAALTFLQRNGELAVPRPLARDDAARAALYQWIEGERQEATPQAVDSMMAFLGRLHRLRHRPDAEALPDAAEACLSEGELVRQIGSRFARLREVTGESGLAALLDDMAPYIEGLESCDNTPLPVSRRSLSPSDFGLHNALSTPDGLVFLDFEYFGWDDPVKLVSDTLWHPGMTLDEALAGRLRAAACSLYGADDPGFSERLDRRHPLFGLRWVMIILNEFLPERWAVRQHAGIHDHAAVKRTQLAKARHRWERVRSLT